MATTAAVPEVVGPLGRAGIGVGASAGPMLAWCGLFLILLARTYRAFLLTLVLAAMVPTLWSWNSYVVRSGSMEPSLSVGDVVVGEPLAGDMRVPVGRVMLFTPPTTTPGHEIRVHRVVENLGDGTYTTAGDANRSTDVEPVPASNFRAQAVILVPFVGLPLTWWFSRDLLPLIIFFVITMAAFYFSSRPPCDPRHRQRRELKKAQLAAEKILLLLRRAFVPVTAVVVMIVAATGGLAAEADAAFNATTANPANTWKVSTTLAKSLVLASPGDVVRGTVPLTATLTNSGGLTYSVRIEYAPAGTTVWKTICTKTAAPYTCDWVTTTFTNQDYDLRAVAVSGSTSFTSALVEGVLVDNAAPAVTMQDPGTPLRGTASFTATATDTGSGVSGVVIQYATTGTSTYKDLCTVTVPPYSCRFDTTGLADGSYSFRAIATDIAGNATTSTAVTNRIVDNTVSSVSMDDPGAFLSGIVTLTAAASSTAGVTSVRIQRAPTGTSTWTDVCTDTTSPYSCGWSTTTVADGLYDLRAILLDGAGKTTISATIASRRVDNSPLRAFDVQSVNGPLIAGKLDTGDTLSLTYSAQAKLSTFTTGWDGSALAVTLRLRDGNILGLGSKGDTLDVQRGVLAVNLGSVNLHEDYIKSNKTAQFAATMTASTTTVNGVTATKVTITVGIQTSGQSPRTVSLSSTMVWTPSVLVTDPAGRAVAGAPASESGLVDRDF